MTTVGGGKQHSDIAYQALRVAQHDAEGAIINVLRYHDAQNAIVFANTRAMVSTADRTAGQSRLCASCRCRAS